MDKLNLKPRDLNLYGEDLCPKSYVFNYNANNRIRLRVYEYGKGKNCPIHKKTLSLPVYLHKPDDFAMFVAKHCGCHSFHVSYSGSDEKVWRLCDIKIARIGRKDVEYAIPFPEDQARLALLLERNRKRRHLMKETTSAGKNRPVRKCHDCNTLPDHMYG